MILIEKEHALTLFVRGVGNDLKSSVTGVEEYVEKDTIPNQILLNVIVDQDN